MKPYDFSYIRVATVAEALSALDKHNGEAKILAGGQSLMATLNMRLSAPEMLIDINDVEELKGITLKDGKLKVGALTRHVEIQKSVDIAQHVPLLKLAVEHVAHAAIRNRGTHGGSLAFADPAAEFPACAIALNANLIIRSLKGERQVSARDFFHDLYETALQENEILLAIEYPLANPATVSVFREFTRRKGDFATAGLILNAEKDGDKLKNIALVLFGIANTPILASSTAAQLVNREITDSLIESAQAALVDEIDVIGDMYAGAEMKLQLIKHFFKQILKEVVGKQ